MVDFFDAPDECHATDKISRFGNHLAFVSDKDQLISLVSGRAVLVATGKLDGITRDMDETIQYLISDCKPSDGRKGVPISVVRRAVAVAWRQMTKQGDEYDAFEMSAEISSDGGAFSRKKIELNPEEHERDLVSEVDSWSDNPRLGFGIEALDNAYGGFYPGEVMGLVGAPGSMKTSLAINMVYNALENTDGRVVFMSLDMAPRAIRMRMLQRELNVSKWELINMIKKSHPAIETARNSLRSKCEGRFGLAGQRGDGKDITWENIHDIIVQTAPDLVIIDYLQLIAKYRNDTDLLFNVLPKITSTAGTYGTRFLLLSQMGRAGRADQKNGLGDHAAGGYYFTARLDVEIELCVERDTMGEAHIIAGVTKTRNGAAGKMFDLDYSPITLAFTGRCRATARSKKDKAKFEI